MSIFFDTRTNIYYCPYSTTASCWVVYAERSEYTGLIPRKQKVFSSMSVGGRLPEKPLHTGSKSPMIWYTMVWYTTGCGTSFPLIHQRSSTIESTSSAHKNLVQNSNTVMGHRFITFICVGDGIGNWGVGVGGDTPQWNLKKATVKLSSLQHSKTFTPPV